MSSGKQCKVVLKNMPPPATPELSKDLQKTIYEKKLLTTRTRKKFLDALDEIHTKSDAERKTERKGKVISEILDSERNYLNQLEKLVNFFMKPIEAKKLLKPNEFDLLFGNIRTIYNINKTLLKELEKKDIAKAFSNIAPFLKLYSTHAMQYKKCLKFLQDNRDNTQFSKFLEAQESRPEVQSKLSALLITPIQRVPRYRLLLEELLIYSTPNSKEYKSLKESLQKVIEAANHINNVVEEQENAQRLLEIHRYLKKGEPNIIVPGRKLIKEGTLTKMSDRGKTNEKMYVVLTNDIIMFCKLKQELKVHSLKCANIFPVKKCKVIEVLDKGCFKIACEDQEHVLYHNQFSETKEWINTTKDTIDKCIGDRKTLRKESSQRRPVKRKDLGEYHCEGLSPGKPLKKRRIAAEVATAPKTSGVETPSRRRTPTRTLSTRKPIRTLDDVSISKREKIDLSYSTETSSFKAEYIKPVETNYASNVDVEMDDVESRASVQAQFGENGNEENSSESSEYKNDDDVEMEDAECKELVLYDQADNNSSFSARVGSFFGGIGNSVRRLFGFR